MKPETKVKELEKENRELRETNQDQQSKVYALRSEIGKLEC